MPSRIQRELAFLLTGRDVSASKSMTGVSRRITALERHSGKAFRNISRNIETGVVLGAGAAAGAIGYAVKQAIDWESAFAGVNKTVEGTPAQLQAIADGLRAMSKEMPVSATELADIAANAGALGIKADDILSFTRTVAMIGATTNVTTEEASTALGQLQNVLGLTGTDFGAFAAALVDLGNKGASTEAQILEIARRAGGSAALIGIAKNETLGWAAAAANLGMNEELAGTSLQRFMQTTLSTVTAGGKKLDILAQTAGMTAKEFKRAFGKDASGALSTFIKGLGKLPKAQRLKVVQETFGKGTGLTRLILGLSDSFDRNLNPSLETSVTAWKDGTAAQVEYQKRLDTTAAQLDIFKNNVNDAAITIGTQLLPLINELAKEGVDWITEHQDEIRTFGQDLAGSLREAVNWASKLDWPAIADTLRAGAGVAKGIVDAFVNAPPWVQQFLAAGFVANKFTGGVIGDVIGELGKGLIKGVLNTNVGVMNVNAGVVNGAGGGTPGVPGTGAAAGGILTTFLAATSVTAIGLAVADAMFYLIPSLFPHDTPQTGIILPKTNAGQSQGALDRPTWQQFAGLSPAFQGLAEAAGSTADQLVITNERLKELAVPAGVAPVRDSERERGFTTTPTGPAAKTASAIADQAAAQKTGNAALLDIKVKQGDAVGAIGKTDTTAKVGHATTAAAARQAGVMTAVASGLGAARIVGAIQANRPIVNVSTDVRVSAATVGAAVTSASRVGTQNGSRNQDRRNP